MKYLPLLLLMFTLVTDNVTPGAFDICVAKKLITQFQPTDKLNSIYLILNWI